MKKHLCFLALAFFVTMGANSSLRADEQLRAVQQTLKDQGFYYGEVDGEEGSETNAAVRRYQIRNGLEVTGKLNAETLASLGLGPQPTQRQPRPPAVVENDERRMRPQREPAPPPVARRPGVTESDRNFLRQQPPSQSPAKSPGDDEETAPPSATAPPSNFAVLFRRTPYERAPLEVQRSTVRRAQIHLYRDGFYRGTIDGVPGAETQRALVEYQRDADLAPTGRLDMDTLSEMNLLPGRRVVIPAPARPFDFEEPPAIQRRVYRGIWIR